MPVSSSQTASVFVERLQAQSAVEGLIDCCFGADLLREAVLRPI